MVEQTHRILLIEPDPDAAQDYLFVLKAWGYEVVRVTNHLLGLTSMEDGPFDLVLVSMEPGGIEGCEFCKLVRRREKTRNITYTGLVLLGENRHLMSIVNQCSGADDFLIKPFLNSEMKWRVANCCQKVDNLRQLRDFLKRTPEDNRFDPSRMQLFVEQVIKRTIRINSPFSLLLIQLKGFELAEVGYGPVTVLNLEEHVLDHLWRFLRLDDQIGKLGQGSYCVLAANLDLTGLERLKARLDRELALFLSGEFAYLDIEIALQGLTVSLDFKASEIQEPVVRLVNWLQDWAAGETEIEGLKPVVLKQEGLCLP